MPAIATSVEVVVAIASAISPIIGGRAFTGNGRRFVPSGRRGVGWTHCFSLFNDLSSSFRLIFYKVLYNCCGQHEVCCSAVSCLSLADMNIVPYEVKAKQMKFVYTVKYTVNFKKYAKTIDKIPYQAYN